MTVCGYQYYNPLAYDANPETRKTDNFVRFLLCNQTQIQGLTQAFFEAGNIQRLQGNNYCYMYFNILKNLPDPCGNCDYCETQQNSIVYQATTLYLFWTTSQKMRFDPKFTAEILQNRKLVYFDSYTKQYKEMELNDLDIQVLLIFMMGEQIQNLYRATNNCFWYLTQGRDYCYLVNFPFDLAGCPLYPLKYGGRELRELTFTYSDAFASGVSPKGKKCLLNRCFENADK